MHHIWSHCQSRDMIFRGDKQYLCFRKGVSIGPYSECSVWRGDARLDWWRQSGLQVPNYFISLTTERTLVVSLLSREGSPVGSSLRGFLAGLDLTYLILPVALHLLCYKHRT